ncbi:hypothetical protein MLD38_015339 [Melastoma candidum]|uniref:Uncharacterized protein n=1 Tax=Melastoma candidum TaxID=119954 RepID=A0ACB9RF35_9MYRT|nr:hypothetical protein MLD38_015339 [Melastoma candidum]
MDENGLELSLGLSFGGSSSNQKGKGSSSDLRVEGDDEGNKTVGEFKGFLDGSKNKLESIPGAQTDVVKPQENFFSDLSKASARAEEDEVGIDGITNKRKMIFDEISHQKKHPKEAKHSDAPDKSKTSHISINTEDGSVAENEDVAESEADGSTSRLVSSHNLKDVHEYKVGNLTYGTPFSVHPMNVVNGSRAVPLRDSSSVSAPGTPIYASSVTRHPLSVAENERQGIKAMTSGNMPVILGYSPVPLPTMDNSWAFTPHPAYTSKGPPTFAPSPANPNGSSEGAQYGQSGRITDLVKGDGKQRVPEEGSSTPAEEDAKAVTDNLFTKFAAIKPGMAADVKFGGSGSVPNLPWVSTTGPGPNGKTISGVPYRYSVDQIRIVCACHGSHLSPEEFVRHASE